MPPWAPERLKLATPHERANLEKRMREKRIRFLEQRNEKLPQNQTNYQPKHSLPEPTNGAAKSPVGDSSAPTIHHNQHHSYLEATSPNQQRDHQQIKPQSSQLLNVTKEASFTDVPKSGSPSSRLPPRQLLTNSSRNDTTDFSSNSTSTLQLPSPASSRKILRKVSLRDADSSDKDSFHTAHDDDFRDYDEILRQPGDISDYPGSHVSIDSHNLADTVQDVIYEERRGHQTNLAHTGEAFDSLVPARESASNETHDLCLPLNTNRAEEIDAFDGLQSFSSENLEDNVSARRQKRGIARKNSFFEEYHFPAADLLPLRSEISLDRSPSPCADCKRWRVRVQDLELQVEALTSALAARELEDSMRARAAVRTNRLPRTTAQLIEECRNLRITTDFLVS